MHCTDLLAYDLEQALKICRAAGWSAEVEYTSPPKSKPSGRFRVIRCVWLAEGRLVLTAAGELSGTEK